MKQADKASSKSTENSITSLDRFFEAKPRLIPWISFGLFILLSICLFEPKVSIGGDDTEYINRAYNLLHQGIFPTFQGPFYPMALAVIMLVTGVNVIAFKIFSVLCLAGHNWFMYKMLRNYVSPSALFAVMVLLCSSSVFLLYGCNTYTESFYLFIQGYFLYYFDKHFIRGGNPFDLKKDYLPVIIAGLLLFLLSITRNIGLVGLATVILYFITQKQWKQVVFILGSFTLFFFTLHIMKVTIWNVGDQQISGQGSTLLLKNSFRPDAGNEDFAGFIDRLIGNSVNYLGFHFLNIFGISLAKWPNLKVLTTIFIYIGLIAALLVYFRKSRFWYFITLFILASAGITFLALQVYWNQERLVLIVVPLLLALSIHGLHKLFTGRLGKFAFLFFALVGILMVANLFRSLEKVPKQLTVLSKYMAGDKFYGFADDWINYLTMAGWVDEHLPDSAFVACRKPGMAFIYSNGRNFHGIYRLPSQDPAELYKILRDAKVTHVIMANLRANPDDPNSAVITTERRYLEAINQAFPGKLKLIHQVGENYPAYLYELN
ncbi:MAG: hypothetical protein U5K79_18440 [Cyclobacteriaceae bacterium]|nr:hypothetical protein [Cyclobacteriaceae bacterium]